MDKQLKIDQFLIVARDGVMGDKSDWCIVAGDKGVDVMSKSFKSRGYSYLYVTRIENYGEIDAFLNYSTIKNGVDNLLEELNDYRLLYDEFGDEEYKMKMDNIINKLKMINTMK